MQAISCTFKGEKMYLQTIVGHQDDVIPFFHPDINKAKPYREEDASVLINEVFPYLVDCTNVQREELPKDFVQDSYEIVEI